MLDAQAESLTRETALGVESIADWTAEVRHLLMQTRAASEELGGGGGNATKSAASSHANHAALVRTNSVLKGVRRADRALRLVKCVLNAHLSEDRPLSKTNVRHIFRLITLVKASLLACCRTFFLKLRRTVFALF